MSFPKKADIPNAMAIAIVKLKHEAGVLGLWRTMHSFNLVEKAYTKDITEKLKIKKGKLK